MHHVVHDVAPPLSEHVAHLWSLSDAPAHRRERIVATGTLELVINLHEDAVEIFVGAARRRFSGAVVSGAYRGGFELDTRAHASIIGVHFRPGGAGPLLGLPPGELADHHVDLDALWGAGARALRDRLVAARSETQRFQILEAALRERLRPARRHPAVRFALGRLDGDARIGQLASEVGLSRRRFVEVFTAEVGMTPKLFSRVRRFQRARALAQTMPWSRVAVECGYYDQSHLIRDVIAFAGVSPHELAGGPPVKEHHVAIVGNIRPRRDAPPPSRSR